MPSRPDPLLDAVRRGLGDAPRVVLAVSGGRDSMVLLEAAARCCPGRIAAVATYDHGTGPAARRAAGLVARRARALGLVVARGRARESARTEAGWRARRWRFLGRVAARHDAVVATAHTRDDQLETVVMRLLRGAGARGLAAMLAPSPVRRPLLALSRDEVARWAEREGVRWVEDPGNQSRAHLRNRVRLDLLPAIERVRPGFGTELLALAGEAARVRAALDAAAARLARPRPEGGILIATADVAGYDPGALAALWPALAARAGATLDRRGTSRAVAFTTRAQTGGTVQLSGGFEIVRGRDVFVVRRAASPEARSPGSRHARPVDGARAAWRLRPATAADPDDLWSATLPPDLPLRVRPWAPGDRMWSEALGKARRVKRYFSDAGVPGMDRAGWPVVLAGSEIVWIPGVRRSGAATDRSGRPGLRYVCERIRQ